MVVCDDRESLLGATTERRPDAVVYVIDDFPFDLRVLGVLRRIAPSIPLVVLSAPAAIQDRRRVQDLRPIYYGVLPLEADEFVEAVHAALGRRADPRAS